jgi:hypothetical protein
VPLDDLVRLVEASPKYYREWSGETPAATVLQVSFANPGGGTTQTKTFEVCDGRVLALDLDSSGRVVGIEFH